jgi:hypothetical protein
MLKRILLSFATAALVTVQVQAQNNYGCFTPIHKATTLFGIQLTPGVPFLSHQNAYGGSKLNAKPTLKCGVGFNLGFMLTDKNAIQVEANYQPMGSNYSGRVYGGSLEREVRLNYWSFPVLYKHYFFNDQIVESVSADKPGKIKWYAEAGPYVAFLAGAQMNNKLNGQEVTIQDATNTETGPNPFVQDVGDDQQLFVKTDLGIVVGGGLDMALMEGLYFNVGLRGMAGFKDINPEKFRVDNPYKASTNAMIAARIGLQMRF